MSLNNKMFDIILACDNNYGIGKNNKLPWRIKEDMEFFRRKTSFTPYPNLLNAVIMGYNTWISIPSDKKPLEDRLNIIITKNHSDEIDENENLITASSFENALDHAYSLKKVHKIFVIGGKQIYDIALNHPDLNLMYLTRVYNDYKCTCNVNINLSEFEEVFQSGKEFYKDHITKDEFEIKFFTFRKIEHQENKYLELIDKILKNGDKRDTRNAKTLSLFGEQLKFDISKSFPLLTTKKMFWKGIVEELLFFLRGETDSKKLDEKGVKIWNSNTTREFLDNLGLNDYQEGEMGPMYGYQWRNFNKPYKKEGSGYDQLKNCIELIKNNPTNRRIMMTTFNPLQLDESVLAPCHSIVIQFYVNNDKLSCHMYQRSADTFLGLPFNIASTSLLTYIISNVTNLKPGEVIISLGDTHLYDDHVEAALKQLDRTPMEFPNLIINKDLKTIDDIENLNFSDFELINYQSHPSIKASMIA